MYMTSTNTTAATIYAQIASAERQMIRYRMIAEVDGAAIATIEGADNEAMLVELLAYGIVASGADFSTATDRPGWYSIPATVR
jgi:hypothetical protein